MTGQINKLHEHIMMSNIGKGKQVFKDSLLEKPFNFYSNYIRVSSEQKERIME